MNVLDELDWRGLCADCTDRGGLEKRLASGLATLYCGFDPSSDSLHVGNLVPLLCLRRFQLAGHLPIALAGGATGCIGDPSGKSQERQLLSMDQLAANVVAVKQQMVHLLDFDAKSNPARLVDNLDWTREVSYLDFLRDIGKHFTVNHMAAKESVRARMEDRESGISYTEFSYMLLQAFDFYELHRRYHCELQIGGSDQWGNITAGMELIRKKLSHHTFGLTVPLLVKADGTKFGKTEAGTVWLDPKKTSIYQFYQYWIRSDDRDVIRYLRFFTFLSREEIAALESQLTANAGDRAPHRTLARAVTSLVHGQSAADEAAHASEVLFGGSLDGISESTFQEVAREIPCIRLEGSKFMTPGIRFTDLFAAAELCPSKGQARKDLEGGGLYLNNRRLIDPHGAATTDELLFGRYLLLRKGKRNYTVIEVR